MLVGTDADWWSLLDSDGWSHTPAYYQSSFHNRGGSFGMEEEKEEEEGEEEEEGAKQALVRLSWPVNQAGLDYQDYHIWTTLLHPSPPPGWLL